jgi:hypothetical protein
MRRVLCVCFLVVPLFAARADAVTLNDVIELSKAGLSDDVLLALIEVDRTVFTVDAPALKQLRRGGVSDTVIIAIIRSGRERASDAPAPSMAPPPEPEPRIVYDDRPSEPVVREVGVPVAVPIAFPVFVATGGQQHRVRRADTGTGGAAATPGLLPPMPDLMNWGFGGKPRSDASQPPRDPR